MDINVKFSNLLADKIGKVKKLTFNGVGPISIREFISKVEREDWGDEVLENGHIKTPVILIIDNELIQISNNNIDHKTIRENSEITFQIMFAGG